MGIDSKTQLIRMITLKNKNTFSLENNPEEKGFALGYHDCIATKLISKTRGHQTPNLKKMWYNDISTTHKEQGDSVAENVYVFRTENETTKITDEAFWQGFEHADDFPFLFITFIRLDAALSSISHLCAGLEEALERLIDEAPAGREPLRGNCECVTYTTTDVTDIVLAIRTKEHRYGAALIDSLSYLQVRLCTQYEERKRRIFNSHYSISTFSSALRHLDVIEKQPFANTVLTVQIRMIASSSEPFFSKLKSWLDSRCPSGEFPPDQVACYSILGNDDFVVTIEQLTWKDLLCFYHQTLFGAEAKSLFVSHHTENALNDYEHFSSYILYPASGHQSLTSQLRACLEKDIFIDCRYKTDILTGCEKPRCQFQSIDVGLPALTESSATVPAAAYSDVRKKLWSDLRGELQKRIKDLNDDIVEFDIKHGYGIITYKSLLETLNYLESYGNMTAPQYGYMIVLDAFLGIVDNVLHYKVVGDILDNEKKMLNALGNINLVLQNAYRAERRNIASYKLNSAIADMPPKLISMHASYLQKLLALLRNIGPKACRQEALGKDVSGGIKRTYSVLYYPSIMSPESEEMTQGIAKDMHRVSIIRTNVPFAIDIRNLWITSSHEMVHKVGRDLKNRKLRFETIRSMSLYSFMDCELRLITKKILPEAEPVWGLAFGLDDIIDEAVTFYLEKLKSEERMMRETLMEGQRDTPFSQYYRSFAQENIIRALESVLFPTDAHMPNCFDTLYQIICRHAASAKERRRVWLRGLTEKEFKIELAAALMDEEREFFEKQKHAEEQVTVRNLVRQSFKLIREVYADIVAILLTGASPERYFGCIAAQFVAEGKYDYQENAKGEKRYRHKGVGLDWLRFFLTFISLSDFQDSYKEREGYDGFLSQQPYAFLEAWTPNSLNRLNDKINKNIAPYDMELQRSDGSSQRQRNPKYDIIVHFVRKISQQIQQYNRPGIPSDLPDIGRFIFQSHFITELAVRFMTEVMDHFFEKTDEALFKKRTKLDVLTKECGQVKANEDLLKEIRTLYEDCACTDDLGKIADRMYLLNFDLNMRNREIVNAFYNRISNKEV